MNTSFRRFRAILLSSEAYRERHGIPLRFARSPIPPSVIDQINADIAAAVADLDGIRGVAARLAPRAS